MPETRNVPLTAGEPVNPGGGHSPDCFLVAAASDSIILRQQPAAATQSQVNTELHLILGSNCQHVDASAVQRIHSSLC
jgi:hypothetical protein